MKQLKVPEAPSLPLAPRGPRYRYFSNPPATVGIRLGDLSDIPAAACTPFFNSERVVDLPTADLFSGPVPKISLVRLAELVPDAFQIGIYREVQLRVPASSLARSYQLVVTRELIEEPPEESPILPPLEETFASLEVPSPAGEKFAPTPGALLPPVDSGKSSEPAAPKEEIPVEEKIPAAKLPEVAPPTPVPPVQKMDAPPLSAKEPEPVLPAVPTVPPVSKVPSFEEGLPPLAKPVSPVIPVEAPLKPLPKIVPLEKKEPAPLPQNVNVPAPLVEPPVATGPAPADLPPSEAIPEPPPAPSEASAASIPARRPFSFLPIFRRKVVETPKPLPSVEPRARVEIPRPKKPLAPLTSLSTEAPRPPELSPPIPPPRPEPPSPPVASAAPEIPLLGILKEDVPAPKLAPELKAPSAVPVPPPVVLKEEVPLEKVPPVVDQTAVVEEASAPEKTVPIAKPSPIEPAAPLEESAPPKSTALVPPPAPPKAEAVFLETEHLPEDGKSTLAEIPEQDSLQALFLTEDALSVERVVELCNGLPGIKSCILTRSGSVVNARNVPDSIDLISLSANALEMFRSLRDSCAKMGIGAVPAVTMHSEKGPITFFHEEDICLLVLHKDRGFVPGVREKLQTVVEELAKANLLLPVSERGAKELK